MSGLDKISDTHSTSRACILVNKEIKALELTEQCARDLAVARIKSTDGDGLRNLTIRSTYFTFNDLHNPPPRDMESLVARCRADRMHIAVGCDANAHHDLR